MPRAATQHFILTLHNIEDNQTQLDEWVSWEGQAVRYNVTFYRISTYGSFFFRSQIRPKSRMSRGAWKYVPKRKESMVMSTCNSPEKSRLRRSEPGSNNTRMVLMSTLSGLAETHSFARVLPKTVSTTFGSPKLSLKGLTSSRLEVYYTSKGLPVVVEVLEPTSTILKKP